MPLQKDIINAISTGNTKKIEQALKRTPKLVNEKDAQGNSILHIAIINNQPEALALLLQNGTPVDICNTDQETALHIAVKKGLEKCVEKLTEYGASLTIASERKGGLNALHLGTERGYPNILEILLRGKTKEVKRTLLKRTDEGGKTPLHYAAMQPDVNLVRLLLKEGADVYAREKEFGATPLHTACRFGFTAIAKELVEFGADLEAYNKNQETPYWLALRFNHQELALELLSRQRTFYGGYDTHCVTKEAIKKLLIQADFLSICDQYTQASELYRQALKQADFPLDQVICLQKLGENIYKNNLIDSLYPNAMAELNKGKGLLEQDKLEEAERLFINLLEDSVRNRYYAVQVLALLYIGDVMYQKENYQAAGKYYDVALRLYRSYRPIISTVSPQGLDKKPRSEPNEDEQDLINQYQKAEEQFGSHISTIKEQEDALRIAINRHGETHICVADSNSNLGTIWKNLGITQMAVKYYEKTLKILLNIYGERHLEVAACYDNLSELLKELGETNKYAEKALTINQAIYQERTPTEVFTAVQEATQKQVTQESTEICDEELNTDQKQISIIAYERKQLEDRIQRLESELKQKSDQEKQQKLEQGLVELKGQVTNIDAYQEILWQEYKIKSERREAIRRFSENSNLLDYYRALQIGLEEIFIGSKAAVSEFIETAEGSLGKAKKVVGVTGEIASMAPLLGTAAKTIFEGIKTGIEFIDRQRQENTVKHISSLATLTELKKICENVARQLTECYKPQLLCLVTTEDTPKTENKLGQTISKAEQHILKSEMRSPAKRLAEFGIQWLLEALKDQVMNINTLNIQLVEAITTHQKGERFQELKKGFLEKFGIGIVLTKDGKEWSIEDIYTKCGIETKEGDFYAGSNTEPEKYGYCMGTGETARRRGLVLIGRSASSKKESPQERVSISSNKEQRKQSEEIKQLQERVELLEQWLRLEIEKRYGLEKELQQIKEEMAQMKQVRQEHQTLPLSSKSPTFFGQKESNGQEEQKAEEFFSTPKYTE